MFHMYLQAMRVELRSDLKDKLPHTAFVCCCIMASLILVICHLNSSLKIFL